jgi:hypothetical protein
MQIEKDERPDSYWIISLLRQKIQKKGPFMSSKFRRNRSRHQANLKIEGQNLFKIDDDGGLLSNFGGLPVAARVAQDSDLLKMAAERIPEWRNPDAVTFPIEMLLAQRVFLTTCGFPGAIDCSFFKDDPSLKSAVGEESDGPPLSSQSTQTRMEDNISESTVEALEALPLDFFFSQFKHVPRALTLYFDGSAIRTFGAQEKSTYRGGKKYSQTQFFPLIATTDVGDLLLAQLRGGGHSDAKSVETIMKLLRDIRAQWKHVELTVVMDTGFNSPELLTELEKEKVFYAIGYPATSSVVSKIKDLNKSAEKDFRNTHGSPLYTEKTWKKKWQAEHERIRSLPTEERMAAEKAISLRHVRWVYQIEHNGVNWDHDRTVINRIDYTDKGLDIRCVVTNIKNGTAESVYDDFYCQRARIETVIKENKSHCKVPLSCQKFTANQFRFTALQGLSYMLLHQMRKELPESGQKVSLNTVRKTLLLIPVRIIISSRRLHWHLSSVHPHSKTVIQMARKLQARTA